jgi:cell division protein ZapA
MTPSSGNGNGAQREVTVTINGRPYKVACSSEEEERLRGLAASLDRRVSDLAKSFGQVGEGQLLVIAGLLLADELDELKQKAARGHADEDRAAQIIEGLAGRVEKLAAQLEGA